MSSIKVDCNTTNKNQWDKLPAGSYDKVQTDTKSCYKRNSGEYKNTYRAKRTFRENAAAAGKSRRFGIQIYAALKIEVIVKNIYTDMSQKQT